jgi:hypothetical protein
MAVGGLEVAYIVIDLTAIEDFWSRWRDCVMRVKDLPQGLAYRNLFADQVRKAPVMALCPGLRRDA